ncbi:MAG: DMT family transporter [Ideonella sp.]|nr:DMT family transporter [Ideonella sp.]
MTERRDRLDAVAITWLVGCCFLWGLNQVAAKVAITEIAGLQQAAVRSLGGALLVWAWARWRGLPLFDADGSLRGGLLAGLLFAAEFGCIFVGLQYTTASRMVVFIYLSPFVVALGMPFITRSERLAWPQVVGLVAAFGGVAWAFAEGFTQAPPPGAGSHQWLGDTLGVMAALLWGATTLAIRGSRLGSVSAEKTLFYQLGISGLALTAAAALAPTPWPRALSALAWGAMLFQTVVVCFASYLVWFWLMRRYPATRLASFTLLTPVFGLVMGALLLGEPITPRLVLALVAVAAGIVLVNRR